MSILKNLYNELFMFTQEIPLDMCVMPSVSNILIKNKGKNTKYTVLGDHILIFNLKDVCLTVRIYSV